MNTKQKERMYQQISNHGCGLIDFFNLPQDTDPIKLCKRLHALEGKAHRMATMYCNGEIETDNWEEVGDKFLVSLAKIIGKDNVKHCFVNGDARGYTLKIDDDYVRKQGYNIYRDWGGYGILAPDFDGRP